MSEYSVKVKAVLDVSGIRQQLAALGKNTKLQFNTDSIDQAKEKLKETGKAGQTAAQGISTSSKKANTEFKGLVGYAKTGAKNFADITGKVALFGAATNIINGASQAAQAMVGSVVELDASLTELKKVSDLSGEGLEKYTNQAFEAGKQVAKTGTQMIDAATEFTKSGFSEQDSLKLGEIAAMYTNIADTEVATADAANLIISQMKAFNIEADDSIHVIDAINEVANKTAVGTND